MRWNSIWIAAVCTTLALAVAGVAQETPPTEKADAKALAQERNQLVREARKHQREGENEKAIKILDRVLALDREIGGESRFRILHTLKWTARLAEAHGDFDDARERLEQALAIHVELLGAEHWEVSDTRRELTDCVLRAGLAPEERRHLSEAFDLNKRSFHHLNSWQYDRAAALAEEAVALRSRILGEAHPDVAVSLINLASALQGLGEYDEAGGHFRGAVDIAREGRGENHPFHAQSLNCLANHYHDLGEYTSAEPCYRQMLRIYERALGTGHRQCALAYNNLALLYQDMGRYAKAEPLYLQALEIDRNTIGEKHPDHATDLNNLACLYELMDSHHRAEPLHLQALEIRRQALGEDHPLFASSLSNLAALYQKMGLYERAEPLSRRALDITRKVYGEGHPDYASELSGLATILLLMGRHEEAESHLVRAVEIVERSLGDRHPHYAGLIYTLALLYRSTDRIESAVALVLRAVEIERRVCEEGHPSLAKYLDCLAGLNARMGRVTQAREHYLRAVGIYRKLLDSTFGILSETQQLGMTAPFRRTLDSYLSLPASVEKDQGHAYAQVLAWKGAVSSRQVQSRRRGEDPNVEALFDRLESVGRRLATLSLSSPPSGLSEIRLRKIRELSVEKEEIERDLSLWSEGYRGARASRRTTPAELQDALPSGVLLLDFLEYWRMIVTETDGRKDSRYERHLLAFLIPADGEIRRIDLGPSVPVEDAVETWRASVSEGAELKVGALLRKLLWDPMAEHLDGAKVILVSPDGVLNRLSLAALPGKKPGSFLIEETPVAVIPVPKLLTSLLSSAGSEAEPESLLLIGDVEYGGSPGEGSGLLVSRSAAGTTAGALPEFRKLASTRAEVAAIRDSFEVRFEKGRASLLRRGRATEAAFRVGASEHRWLHLATHGFFAPPGLRSALANSGGESYGEAEVAGYHPGLLSGLALSGANTPPEPDGDDGILTALEVASLDLSGVEMAVLSACETGLGEVAGGEGALGLQRAFQVAGARTTVTSLWEVPDVATQLLMQRFYENLWDKEMTKLEALREAQLWLMKEGRKRGLGTGKSETEDRESRLPPYYWGGWVLSGDWR